MKEILTIRNGTNSMTAFKKAAKYIQNNILSNSKNMKIIGTIKIECNVSNQKKYA